MPESAQLGLVELSLIALSLIAWWWVVARWRSGSPPLPAEPRAEVRWDFADVLVTLLIYFTITQLGAAFFLEKDPEGAATADAVRAPADTIDGDTGNLTDETSQHPVIQLLSQQGTLEVVILVFLVAAISAPLWEEFFFRLLLLGWMAKQERIWKTHTLSRVPLGIIPLLVTSLAFAMMHFRQADPQVDADFLIRAMKVTCVANFATLAISIAYLRVRHQATAADLGFSMQHLARDLKTAACGFFIVAVPLLFLQFILKQTLPSDFAPDPIPLFFLALVFGLMYLRSGRLTSCVLLHAMLNAFSLLAALAFIHGGAGKM